VPRRTRLEDIDFRSVLERIPAITYVSMIADPDRGPLIYVSPQSKEILGYQEEWLQDTRLWDKILHPEDRDAVLAESARSHRTGDPWNRDYRLIARDGRIVWIRDHATLVRDPDGRPLHWHGVMLDITAQKLAEQALLESESRYRAVVEQIPAVTYVTSSEEPTRLIYISPQVDSLLGIPADQWLKQQRVWRSRLHPDDRKRVLSHEAATRRSGGTRYSDEYRMLAADDRVVWFHDEARLVHDPDGRPLLWQGVMLDITTRKQAAEARRETDAAFRALVENIPAVVYIARPDDDSTTLYVSPQIERILGYTQQEWLDQPDIWMELLHDEDREQVLAAHDLHNETGEPWRAEYRLIAADGRVVWFRDEATLVRDDQGRPMFWQGVRLDITDRKTAEEKLERAREELEMRVLERTVQLSEANELMMLEVEERRKAERRHKEAEERFRTLVEQLPAVVYIWRLNGTVTGERPAHPDTYTSPEIEHLLGFTPEEWQSRANFWLDRIHPDDRERVWAHTLDVVRDGGVYDAEYRFIAKDGRIVWVHDRATPMRADDSLYQGVIFDITERKRAEERLRKADERYRALVEEMPAVVYFWHVDPGVGGTAAPYASPQIEELLGYTGEEWVAMGTPWNDRLHPDDRDRVIELSRHCAGTGETFDAEYRLLAKNGEIVWIQDRAALVERDENGRPRYFQGVMLDITKRKRAETQLREAESLYRSLVEQIPAVTYVESARPGGGRPRTLYVSPQVADMIGYSPEEIIADPELWVRILHPEDRQRVIEADERSSSTGEPFDQEFRYVTRGGETVWVRSHSVLIRDDDGSPLFWQGVTFDITRRMEAERELRSWYELLMSRAGRQEEQLRETEEVLKELVAVGPGIIFMGSAADLRLEYVSPNVEQVLGYPADEVMAPGWWQEHIHPDDLNAVVDALGSARSPDDALVEIRARMIHRDGAARTFQSVLRFRFDEDGRPATFFGVSIDVTHRDAVGGAAGKVRADRTN
jgi:PAS domain S-box-containing protein